MVEPTMEESYEFPWTREDLVDSEGVEVEVMAVVETEVVTEATEAAIATGVDEAAPDLGVGHAPAVGVVVATGRGPGLVDATVQGNVVAVTGRLTENVAALEIEDLPKIPDHEAEAVLEL